MLALTKLQKIWPRSLSRQLAFANILILSITIVGFAVYSAYLQTTQEQQTYQKQLEVFSKNIASLTERYVVSNHLDYLEAKLQQLIYFPQVTAIYVLLDNNRPLLSIRKREDGRIVSETTPKKTQIPINKKDYIRVLDNYTEFWQPLYFGKNNQNRGWVYVEYNTHAIKEVSLEIFKHSLSIALIAIIVSLLVLRKLLSKPMKEMRRAGEFAEWLDLSQGNQIDVNKSSIEIEQLLRALNKTSEKLHRQEENQRSHSLLLDTIRDVQSRFISDMNLSNIFENVVMKIIQLTKSEHGFFGEVKIDENNKTYMQIRAVSNIASNNHTDAFYDKYDINNLKFYNMNNLFGAVIQAKKVVIANDVMSDPRRGGLPHGHPYISAFLGLPIYSNDRVVGIIGVANRKDGYEQGVVAYLQPLLSICGHIMEGCRNEEHRRQIQDELRKKNLGLQTVLNSVSDGILTINNDGVINSVNTTAANMFTYQTDSMVGSCISEYIPDLIFKSAKVNVHGNQLPNNIGNESFEWRMNGKHKDGTFFPLEISLKGFKQRDEKYFTVTIHNMEHNIEAQRLKAGFLDSVNDELRESLASIRSSLSMLSGNVHGKLNKDVLAGVKHAQVNTDNLIQLFDNVSNISKIESGEIELRMNYVNTAELIDQAIANNQDICRKYNVSLSASIINEIMFFCDEIRILQVIRSLISYAAQNCHQGDVIEISIQEQQNDMCISITGCTSKLDSNYHANNINKFSRLYLSDLNRAIDNDFDLHLCKAIVDHHGGKVGYDSASTHGAHFFVKFPNVGKRESVSNL